MHDYLDGPEAAERRQVVEHLADLDHRVEAFRQAEIEKLREHYGAALLRAALSEKGERDFLAGLRARIPVSANFTDTQHEARANAGYPPRRGR